MTNTVHQFVAVDGSGHTYFDIQGGKPWFDVGDIIDKPCLCGYAGPFACVDVAETPEYHSRCVTTTREIIDRRSTA